MNTPSTTLPVRAPRVGSPIGLLAGVGLASALAGALVTLAVWRELAPDRPPAPIARASAASPALAQAPTAAPSMHEALRGREDPPADPVPTF